MTQTLEKGDLIGVAYSNFVYPAIYFGKGKQGNPHFFLTNLARIGYAERRLSEGKKIYVDFINRRATINASPIVKITYEDLTDEQKDHVNKHRNILTQAGIL